VKHTAIAVVLAALVPLTISAPTLARSPQGVSQGAHPSVVPQPTPTAMRSMASDPYHGFTKTDAPIRRALVRLASTCGHAVTGTGYALFTPGVAGKMHGPHMILQVGLTESRRVARWELETVMRQGNTVRDDSSVGDVAVNSHGNGTLTERTMPNDPPWNLHGATAGA